MRRWSTILLAAALAVGLAWLCAPFFAMRALQAAARDGDVQALGELVDYRAVRAGLRAEPQSAALEPEARLWTDPVGAVRQAWEGRKPAPTAAERQLTPVGLNVLAGPPRLLNRVRHWGPNRVRFAVASPRGESLFAFQRTGLFRWRLVNLSAPPVSAALR